MAVLVLMSHNIERLLNHLSSIKILWVSYWACTKDVHPISILLLNKEILFDAIGVLKHRKKNVHRKDLHNNTRFIYGGKEFGTYLILCNSLFVH